MGTCVGPLQSAEGPKDVNKVMARFAGNVVTQRVEVRNDMVKKAGVERIIVWSIYETKGDKISYGLSARDHSDLQTARFDEWVRTQPPAR